jgi:hypothetical protein
LTGWATKRTWAEELNCRDAVRLFGSGSDGAGSEVGFVSGAGIGSSFFSSVGLFTFSSNVRCGALEFKFGGDAAASPDGTLHDEQPEDGAP